MEITLDQGRSRGYVITGRVRLRGTAIAEDRRVDAASKALVSEIRVSSNPWKENLGCEKVEAGRGRYQ